MTRGYRPPQALTKADLTPTDVVRFCQRIDIQRKADGNGAWLWTGSLDPDGYGHFKTQKGYGTRAHRIAYVLFVADLEFGQTVHHDHRHPKNNVNPAHLLAVSNSENVAERNARRTIYTCPTCGGGKVYRNSTINDWVCLNCDPRLRSDAHARRVEDTLPQRPDDGIPI